MKSKPAKAKSSVKRVAPRPTAKKAAPKPAPKAVAKKAAPAKPATAAKGAKPAPKAIAKISIKIPSAKPAPAPKPKPKPKPISTAARRKELAHFRDLLLAKRQSLMRAYTISKGDSQSDLDNGTEDYVDYAVNSYAREFLLSLTELDRKQLLLVEEALGRIDRNEFGTCQQCGEEINRKRLEVQPWARHCVRCQELEEQGLLPQYPAHVGDEELAEEPDDAATREDEVEADADVEDPVIDEEPLVVDGDDSEEE